MLSRLYYFLRLSLPEDETSPPPDCRPLRPTNESRSGLDLPPQEEPLTSLPAALDKFVEISQDIKRRIDTLADDVEQLREQTTARRKRRKLVPSKPAPHGGAAVMEDETPQIIQHADEQQVQSDPRPDDGCDACEQLGGAKSRRCCGVCGTPGHNARTCQTQAAVKTSTEEGHPWLVMLDKS